MSGLAERNQKILIIGAGEMSRAFGHLLKDRHHCSVWQRRAQTTLATFKSDEDFIFLCVPTAPHREILTELKQQISSDTIFVTVAKGLDSRGDTATAVLEQELRGKCNFVGLYGPMISEEMSRGEPGYADISGSSNSAATRVQQLFANSSLKTKYSDDLIGINWSGVLKNIYAIITGISNELMLSSNFRGILVSNLINEMREIVELEGGCKSSVFGAAGVGDLITTMTSSESSHQRFGRLLASGVCPDSKPEGYNSLKMLAQHSPYLFDLFPILSATHKICQTPKQALELIRELQ